MDQIVLAEYKDLLERKWKLEIELQELVKGYVSKKTIKGKTYCYLQNRVEGKLTCRYLKSESVSHPHGIKVMLEDGQVGRVQEIVG